MNVSFKYNDPDDAKSTKVYFEQIFAEKPAGGLVANPAFDVETSTAVGKNAAGLYAPIKGYRLLYAVGSTDTSIQIAKGSGVAVGDFIGYGKVAVKATAVNTNNEDYDVVTVTMGVAIAKGEVCYQASSASSSAATPIYTPEFVVGDYVMAGNGDQRIRLINGANLRKETAVIGKDIAALMPAISLV